MGELFKAKVRSVGSSLGILIPMNIARDEGIEEGTEIDVSLLKKNKKLIDESFGMDKGKIKFKFKRDKTDRT